MNFNLVKLMEYNKDAEAIKYNDLKQGLNNEKKKYLELMEKLNQEKKKTNLTQEQLCEANEELITVKNSFDVESKKLKNIWYFNFKLNILIIQILN
jgi:hypothetical protein